ncbi:MAG TPA: biotin--[acetyl-CoA-carboxylase] ligase [Clostridiales bacterium]|nr:biotin--[acetyl-CoA-carboxylase] ligase [Clostridiales bacterium]
MSEKQVRQMKKLQIKLNAFESLDSTNTYLKKLAAEGAGEGTAVIANAQTAGRGRMGRSFASAQGLGVYMSLLLRPDCAASCAQSLTANTAAAVCMAIETVSGVKPEIKWVNDLYLKGKKICGILCESAVSGDKLDYAVIGIGLNVITRPEDFPEELRHTAGSIYSQTGLIIERGKLISAILTELGGMYAAWCEDKSAYLNEYKSRCTMLGRVVTVISPDGDYDALAKDITPDFGLVVETVDGETRTLHSGEISVKI